MIERQRQTGRLCDLLHIVNVIISLPVLEYSANTATIPMAVFVRPIRSNSAQAKSDLVSVSNGGGSNNTSINSPKKNKCTMVTDKVSVLFDSPSKMSEVFFKNADPTSQIDSLIQWYQQGNFDLVKYRWQVLSKKQQIKDMSNGLLQK